MKYSKPFTTFLTGAALALSLTFATAQEVLIDTGFTEVDENQRPLVVEEPRNFNELPLKRPTKVAVGQQAEGIEVGVTVSKEAIGQFTPPFAMIKTGEREGQPDVAANLSLDWSLRHLELESGIYRAQFKLGAGQTDKGAFGFIIRVAQKTPDPDLRLYPHHVAFSFWFTKNGVVSIGGFDDPKEGRTLIEYTLDQALEFDVTINLTEWKWSLSVDGKQLVSDVPFPAYLKDNTNVLQSIGVSCGGGVGTEPNAQYFLGPLKLIRMDAPGQ